MSTTEAPTSPSDAQLRRIYGRALAARRLEERVERLAASGEVPSTLHLGAGQEVCQVAALTSLEPTDPMLYAHRGVGYWTARDVPMSVVLCDLAGRVGGSNAGRGGVMHVIDPDRGVVGQSGTVGGNFVVGVGVAFAEQRLATGSVTIVFFGDGTANRGQFHEALNFAALHRLPCIFFCENNGWGLSVPIEESTSVPDIATRAVGYGIPGVVVDGRDARAVFAATAQAAVRARAGDGPTLIEAKVPRRRGHYIGDRERYRTDESKADAAAADPLVRLRDDILGAGVLSREAVEQLEAAVAAEVEDGLAAMRAAPRVEPVPTVAVVAR